MSTLYILFRILGSVVVASGYPKYDFFIDGSAANISRQTQQQILLTITEKIDVFQKVVNKDEICLIGHLQFD